jgi:hypothetical protein
LIDPVHRTEHRPQLVLFRRLGSSAAVL